MVRASAHGSSTRLIAGALALGAVAIVVLLQSRSGSSAGVTNKAHWSSSLLNSRKQQCTLDFMTYEPSEWEEEWTRKAGEYQRKACKMMHAQKDLVDAWMEPMNASFTSDVSAATLPAMQNTKVFSHFRHRDSCTGDEVRTPIEPLVGLLRHPAAGPNCRRPDRPEFIDIAHDPPGQQATLKAWCKAHSDVDCLSTSQPKRQTIENKGYMIIQPLPAATIAALYPGRKYLFDLGTGRFSSGSLPWFMSVFGDKDIEFDEIFGWEITPVEDELYWKEWPPHLSHKMHFRNVPCSVDPEDSRNPLNILRRLYKPGDYVAFKLDIDNEPIEQALLKQMDDGIIDMIAEFFTEIHFDIPEMRGYFGHGLNNTLSDVINEIRGFRDRGLRIHYWP